MNWDFSILTNKQIVRLYWKIRERIERGFAGGLRYGWDMPTLWATSPERAVPYVAIVREARARKLGR